MSEECLGRTRLPIWGGKRLGTGLPNPGRGESGKKKTCPEKERGDTETGENRGQADEMGGIWGIAGWYQARAASSVIWGIKAKISCGWLCQQPKSILMIKDIKWKERKERQEKLPNLLELRAGLT